MKYLKKVVRMIATSRQMYAGRALKAEEEFDAAEDEVGELEAIKMARKADEPVKRIYQRRDMEAQK